MSGLARDCGTNKGGIKALYATYADAIASVTITDGKVSAIEFADANAPEKFKKYVIRKGMGTMTKTLTPASNGLSNYVAVAINVNWPRMETVKREEMAAFAVNECVCIVEDANGLFWLVGYSEPVRATGGESTTGTAAADSNQYGLSLGCDEATFPYEIPAALMATLVEA